MAKAKKLPSGSWRVQVSKSVNGTRIRRYFTADTARKAERMAEDWQDQVAEEYAVSERYTVARAIEEYIKLKSAILSPCTIRCYKSIKTNNLGALTTVKLEELTTNKIQLHINELSKTLSPKTVRNVYGLLTAILRQFSPNTQIGRISLPQKRKSQNQALSKSDISVLINGIVDNVIEIPVLLALWCGMRRSEICALEWSDVDLNNGTISINKALVADENNKYVIKCPKTTDSERIVNLPNYIANKLKSLTPTENRIFPMLPHQLSKRFKRVCEKLGLEGYHFHDLRRSMATVGLSLNIADKIIMSIGGWNNPQTMKNIYQIVLQDDKTAATETINNYFESLIVSNNVTQNVIHN